MILARRIGGSRFAAQLAARAGRLAEVHAEARRRGERRWRLARLLWPTFAKER